MSGLSDAIPFGIVAGVVADVPGLNPRIKRAIAREPREDQNEASNPFNSNRHIPDCKDNSRTGIGLNKPELTSMVSVDEINNPFALIVLHVLRVPLPD